MRSSLLIRVIFIVSTLFLCQISFADGNNGVVVDDGGNLKMAPQGSQPGSSSQSTPGAIISPYGTPPGGMNAQGPGMSGGASPGSSTNVPVPNQQMSPDQMQQGQMQQDGSATPPPGWTPPPGAVKQDQSQSSGSSGM